MGVCVGFHVRIAHRLRQVILGTRLAGKTLVDLFSALVAFYLTLDLRTHGVQRLNAAFALLVDDMPSVVGTNRFADLA